MRGERSNYPQALFRCHRVPVAEDPTLATTA
jgi:hypothetical protein